MVLEANPVYLYLRHLFFYSFLGFVYCKLYQFICSTILWKPITTDVTTIAGSKYPTTSKENKKKNTHLCAIETSLARNSVGGAFF